MLATIPSDGSVRLWDMGYGTRIRDLGGGGGYNTSDAHFSSNGEHFAVDLATGLFLWRVSDGQLLWNEVTNSMAIAYSPDGQYLAYSDLDDGNKIVLASPDASSVIVTLGQMQGPVWELFFSPDASMLAATDGLEIRVWGIQGGNLLHIGKPHCP